MGKGFSRRISWDLTTALLRILLALCILSDSIIHDAYKYYQKILQVTATPIRPCQKFQPGITNMRKLRNVFLSLISYKGKSKVNVVKRPFPT